MGRWGEGNFDDDLARDYLNGIIAGQEQFVERIFAGEMPEKLKNMNFYEAGESFLMPAVEIMLTLHKNLKGEYLPTPRIVLNWLRAYLNRVDELLPQVLPGLGSQEWFRNERRPVIEATFKELLECSRELFKHTADEE
ncbi:MAG: hypothetical protein ACLQGP_02860 [Isosphaeraceae bacterium]